MPSHSFKLIRRQWRDGVESCYSCSSVIQAIRARTGDCQADKLSQGKSF